MNKDNVVVGNNTLFSFTDEKSQQQIAKFINDRNDCSQLNREGLARFRQQWVHLADARGICNGDQINGEDVNGERAA